MSANFDHVAKAKAIIDSFTASFPDVPIRSFKKFNTIGEFCQISGTQVYEFGDIIPILKIETSTKPNSTVHAKLRVNDDYYEVFNTMIEKHIFDNHIGDFKFVVESFDDSQGNNHINFVLISKMTIVDTFRKVTEVLIPQLTKLIKNYAEVVIPEEANAYKATSADFPVLANKSNTNTKNNTKATSTWIPVTSKDPTPVAAAATATDTATATPAAPAQQNNDEFPALDNRPKKALKKAPKQEPIPEPKQEPIPEPIPEPKQEPIPEPKQEPIPEPIPEPKQEPAAPASAPARAFTPVQTANTTQAAVPTPVHSPIVTHASNPQKQLFPRPPMMHNQQHQFPYPPMGMPMCQPPFMPFNGITKESLDAEQMQISDMEMRIVSMQKELDFMKRAHTLNIAHYNRIISLRQDSDYNPHAWQEVASEQ